MIAFDSNNRYIQTMRRVLAPVTAFAIICLLVMQLSGFHTHIEMDGSDAGLHGTHVHHAGPDEHDHGTEIDVPLIEELGFFSAKLIPFLFTSVIALLAIIWIRRPIYSLLFQPGKTRHRIRWRPPLRAPPLSN